MGVTQNMWNRRVPLPTNDVIVMHSASSMVHYPPPPAGMPLDIDEQYTRPRAVKREFSEMDQVSQGTYTGLVESRVWSVGTVVMPLKLQWDLCIEDTIGTQLAVLYTVEPLYRGHHWDPAGCPVYSGTSL